MKNKSEKPQTNKDQFSEKPTEDKTVTRRNFIKNTAIAGAGAAAILQNESSLSLIHISEPTRRTPISYAVFCLKKKK